MPEATPTEIPRRLFPDRALAASRALLGCSPVLVHRILGCSSGHWVPYDAWGAYHGGAHKVGKLRGEPMATATLTTGFVGREASDLLVTTCCAEAVQAFDTFPLEIHAGLTCAIGCYKAASASIAGAIGAQFHTSGASETLMATTSEGI